MSRRTPEQELAYQMQKMKDMGVTISTRPASSLPDEPRRAVHVIAEAAKEANIYEENK